MEGGCAGNDSMSCEAGVVRGPVQVFDGTPLLFFHLKSPPSQVPCPRPPPATRAPWRGPPGRPEPGACACAAARWTV